MKRHEMINKNWEMISNYVEKKYKNIFDDLEIKIEQKGYEYTSLGITKSGKLYIKAYSMTWGTRYFNHPNKSHFDHKIWEMKIKEEIITSWDYIKKEIEEWKNLYTKFRA